MTLLSFFPKDIAEFVKDLVNNSITEEEVNFSLLEIGINDDEITKYTSPKTYYVNVIKHLKKIGKLEEWIEILATRYKFAKNWSLKIKKTQTPESEPIQITQIPKDVVREDINFCTISAEEELKLFFHNSMKELAEGVLQKFQPLIQKFAVQKTEKNTEFNLSSFMEGSVEKSLVPLQEVKDNSTEKRSLYFDVLENDLYQLDEPSWINRLEAILEQYNPQNPKCIQELESVFSIIAQRWERDQVITNKDLYRRVFPEQMKLLSRLYKEGFLGPLTKRPRIFSGDIGCKWVGDCWIWDLMDLISESPHDTGLFFPIHKDSDKTRWIDLLDRVTFLETPYVKKFLGKSFESIRKENKDYIRLVDISFLLFKRINISVEVISKSTLLFPAWLINEFLNNNRPTLQYFLKLFNSQNIVWDECILYLSNKYLSDKSADFATFLLQEILAHYSSFSGSKSIISMIFILQNCYPNLSDFLQQNANIELCQKIHGILAPLPEEYEKIDILPHHWKSLLLNAVIKNEEARKSILEYLKNGNVYNRQLNIENKYWLEIVDGIKPEDWDAIRTVWNYVPELVFEKAKKELYRNIIDADMWFAESDPSIVKKLCKELVEFRKTRSDKLPDWCTRWFLRRVRDSDDLSLFQEFYTEIFY